MKNLPKPSPCPEISLLQRREIQAGLAGQLLRAFSAELGQEKTLQIAGTVVAHDAETDGRMAADACGGNSLAHLVKLIRANWTADGSLEMEILAVDDRQFNFNVHRCLFAEMYARLGIKEYGYCLSCSRDEAFLRGFNPRLKLVRTRTLMQGADLCDFRYTSE